MAINPILTGERRNQYTSSGSLGPYNFTFVIYADTDLAVYVDSTKKTLTTHYTVSTNTNGTGSITFTSGNAPASSSLVTIIGNKDLSRTTKFTSGGPLTADALETEFNNQTLFLQQLDEKISRAITLPIETDASRPLAFPYNNTESSNANRLVKFNSAGSALEIGPTTTNVDALAAIASDISAVAAISSSDLSTVASIGSSNMSAVAGKATEIGLLGNSDTVADMALLGTSAVVADMALLANSDVIADMNTLATTDIVNDLNLLATSDFVSDLNAVEGIKANVTTVANNITGVNSFAERYRVGSSDPTSSLDEGDLFYNSTDNAVKFYNGSSWASIQAGLTDIVGDVTPQLGGNLDVNGNSIVSVSNGNIAITPNGSGKVILDGLSFPTADGTNGQALVTDGGGNVSFSTIQASELTTEGSVFSNYNTISSNATTTTASTKNAFLFGPITISGSATWTVTGNGTLEIL